MRTFVLLLSGMLWTAAAAAQAAPRYAAAPLRCARFAQRVESRIRGEAGGRARQDDAGWSAVWIVRVIRDDSPGGDTLRGDTLRGDSLRIEGWFDTLAVWRTTDGVVRAADTDGILGGRYRGILGPFGTYTALAGPFVPEVLADFVDMRDAMAELLPRLPPRALRPGAAWRDGTSLEIQRLGDSSAAGHTVQRYRLERQGRERDTTIAALGDTVSIAVTQRTDETGEFAWDPVRGMVHRLRHITVVTQVPAGNGLRYPVRSLLDQRVTIDRLPDAPDACP